MSVNGWPDAPDTSPVLWSPHIPVVSETAEWEVTWLSFKIAHYRNSDPRPDGSQAPTEWITVPGTEYVFGNGGLDVFLDTGEAH